MTLRSAFLAAVLLSVASARADIVGGEEVRPKDPIRESIAALYEPGSGGESGSLCTASVIGPHTAVTAAHCVSPQGPKPVLIFGNDVRGKSRELRPVTDVAVNPRWGSHQGVGMDQGDIALVKFRGGLPGTYHPVPVLQSESALKKGKAVTLAGYGISDPGKKTGAGVLRKTRVKIEGPRPGKSEMILDQSQGKGACHGDSGGPAFIRQAGHVVLAGVTNRGYPETAPDDCRHKVVYTKVSAYSPWINVTRKRFESAGSSSGGSGNEASRSLRAAKSRIGRRLPMGASTLARMTPAKGSKPSKRRRSRSTTVPARKRS
jgi:hypothetical protein